MLRQAVACNLPPSVSRVEYAAYTLPKAEKLPGSNGLQLPLVPHLGKQPTSAGELTVRLANRTMNSRESCTGSSAEHRDQSPCRRNIVASLLGCGLILEATKSRSEDLPQEGLMDEELQALILLNSNVVPSLTKEEYLSVINKARPLAWEQMERDIKEDGFARLSASLLFGPFDEVMQSTFFLPWAMLKDNVDAAVRARAAYMILESDVQRLKDVADAASRYQAEAEEVQASLDIVAFSLNQMLETVTAPGMEDLTNTAS